ncbi:transcriptional regulator [Bifidobacterium sp. UTCIF-37]|uniref:Probable cell division protein WhiA n=2 Tax=Bifidobacterium callitrichos TaxID=762209 RepID=A0A2T3G8F1_9BIFI|nr:MULTISPECIES: DNA-binding protein WhiA [Bifidobacterium]KAA8817426.1 DNA-binding protein WhiA [Bifidobacterium callitrichos]KFI56648.1 sporulation protein [Bifidobacterium callitrichos DSM 23973]PST45732.1 DNA-binding protein WhiA [Bifidobacterium callitrichos]TPF86608.1 transcriptional regulator [Bifidobacterium sp. UTCIF-37]TPF90226.1 transcriptional regulator [Bifidobacterium sp. UTCIF-38]
MALLDDVKSELAALEDEKADARKAQVTAMIRFAGGFTNNAQKQIVMLATFDSLIAAQWLQRNIEDLYNLEARLITSSRTTPKGTHQYHVVKVERGAVNLAVATGLIDRNKAVRGLPVKIVQGKIAQVRAAWRGAFMAKGILSDLGKNPYMEIICPGNEAAMALAGLARRLGITAKPRQLSKSYRVTLTDPDSIERMLNSLGALRSAREWTGKRTDGETRSKANRLANFDDANMRRSAKAAAEACEKVRKAFELFEEAGVEVPDNLLAAGKLRLEHGDASLEELGRLAEPPISKDAIAGRIRRLLQLAEKTAKSRS